MLDNIKNYYEILEIEKNATNEQIKKAYHKLAQQWHPDKWITKSECERKQAEEKFKEIAKAYEILSDLKENNFYDNITFNNFSFEEKKSPKSSTSSLNWKRISKEQTQVREQINQEFSRYKIVTKDLDPEWQDWEAKLKKITNAHKMGEFSFAVKKQIELAKDKKIIKQFQNLNLEEVVENWKNIHSEFTPELQKKWEDWGFTYEQCRRWIKAGLATNDAEFAYWLEYVIKVDIERAKQALSCSESRRKLREKYQCYQNEAQSNINISYDKK